MITERVLLDLEMGTPPPSNVDIDAAIGREQHRRRLWQAAVGGVVVALALTAGVALTRSSANSGNGFAPVAPPVAATPRATAHLTPAEQEAARLTAVLKARLAVLLPDAIFTYAPPAQEGPLVFNAYQAVFRGNPNYFDAAANIQEAAGTGSIYVASGGADGTFAVANHCDTGDPPPPDAPHDPGSGCTETTENGATVMVDISNYGKHHQVHLFWVVVTRAGGHSVCVQVLNVKSDAGADGPTRGYLPTPPLTVDQVTTLAEDPDLATALA